MANKAGLALKPINYVRRQDDFYIRTAVGIVKQAVCDYYYFHKRIEHCQKMIDKLTAEDPVKNKGSLRNYTFHLHSARKGLGDLKVFFYGDWIKMLVHIDGPMIYEHLEKQWADGVRGIYREYILDITE